MQRRARVLTLVSIPALPALLIRTAARVPAGRPAPPPPPPPRGGPRRGAGPRSVAGGLELWGWDFRWFPRRARTVGIGVRGFLGGGRGAPVGESRAGTPVRAPPGNGTGGFSRLPAGPVIWRARSQTSA